MKILITGAYGFIGKNLSYFLKCSGYEDLYLYDQDTDEKLLDKYTKDCSFVYHLAGVNRPKDEEEFMEGNYGFTSVLLDSLKKNNNKAPILITSSIQAELDNSYGKSKKAGEELIFKYGKENNVRTYVYRLTNVFGKWSKPNYNTVIATFCYNIGHELPIIINDPNVVMNLMYIDDVVDELMNALVGKETRNGEYCEVSVNHTKKLGEIADLIYSFKDSRNVLSIPDMSDPLVSKLYSTYLSFLSEDAFSYPLKMNLDNRGSFTEIIRTIDRGQCSINVSEPGIIKGNHWHHSKNEKFLVVSGTGVIRFRKLGENKVIEYHVNGDKLEMVDIPTGYIHNIENLGNTNMVTFMWANVCFNTATPDTYYEEV